jgi:hypothetical protein
MGYAMRTKNYRYIEWLDRKTKELKAAELYDHQIDPSENNNAVNDPKYANILKTLQQQMKAGWKGAIPNAKKNKKKQV